MDVFMVKVCHCHVIVRATKEREPLTNMTILETHRANMKEFDEKFSPIDPKITRTHNLVKIWATSSTKAVLESVKEWAEENAYKAYGSVNAKVIDLSSLSAIIDKVISEIQ